MAEPIGGKEHKWGWGNLLVLGSLLELCATVLGWMVLIFLPLFLAQDVFKRFGNTSWTYDGWRDLLQWKSFWIPFGSYITVKLTLVLCAFWFIAVVSSLLVIMYSRKKSKSLKATSENPSIDTAPTPEVLSINQTIEPVIPVAGLLPAAPEQERKKAEQERKRIEQERREKIDKARKEFKAKAAKFKDSLPSVYELSVAGGVVDFSEKFNATPLKVMMKEGSLRSYLTWNHEAMTLKVNDAFAFFKDGKARFCLEISDSTAAVDNDLKDEIKPETLEVVLQAKYPSAAQKFFEWKAKLPASIRLENAKQGQLTDYDIKSLLGYDPDWAVWAHAEGLGSLQPDFDTHRIKGEPTVGSDAKLHLIFTCRGCEEITHELDLLLTCNMDPELRWKEIERDQSDNDPVVAEEDGFSLAKMAEALRSAANGSGVRNPDAVFSKPNRVSRRQKSEDFDLAYASIRGRSHIRTGSFREDDVEARFFLDGKAVAIVVSDGAGSAPLSRRGSCVVTAVGIKCLIELGQKLVVEPEALNGRSQFAVDAFAAVVQSIRSQIEFEADCIKEQRPGFLAKEMYATFLAALVLPTASGHVLLTYSAGDGAIGLGLAGDASGIKCSPDHGQSAGQTLFILNKGADDADKRLVFTSLPDSYALLLMSDGVSDPRFLEDSEMKPEFWNQLSDELKPRVREEPLNHDAERVETYKERGALCTWLDSYEKGHHDDRTIAVLFHKLS
jgi:hypothetical protein